MRVKNFKQFENKEVPNFDIPLRGTKKNTSDFLSEDDIRDLFSELLDQDYKIEFVDTTSDTTLFFDLKKIFSEDTFGLIEKGSAYGVSDIRRIQEEPPKFLNIIEEIKLRLNKIGYEIGFEFEFHFGATSMIFASCHAQHKDYIPED